MQDARLRQRMESAVIMGLENPTLEVFVNAGRPSSNNLPTAVCEAAVQLVLNQWRAAGWPVPVTTLTWAGASAKAVAESMLSNCVAVNDALKTVYHVHRWIKEHTPQQSHVADELMGWARARARALSA